MTDFANLRHFLFNLIWLVECRQGIKVPMRHGLFELVGHLDVGRYDAGPLEVLLGVRGLDLL